jgi:hypothetical protein
MNCSVFNTVVSENVDIFEYKKCAILTQIGNKSHSFYLKEGFYFFELWGAAGGLSPHKGETRYPGNGSYVSGNLNIIKKMKFYAFVGTKGGDNTHNGGMGGTGGFNGGGKGGDDDIDNNCGSGGGGGATDIRFDGNDFYSRIIVAGGGGSPGCYVRGGNGGSGGTIYGKDGDMDYGQVALGGKGANFDDISLFGIGENGMNGNEAGGAGGGGYFGGHRGNDHPSTLGGSGGGGGSSYVSGYPNGTTINRDNSKGNSIHFTGIEFIYPTMKSGDEDMVIPSQSLVGYHCHTTHGCIRITQIHLYLNCTKYSKTSFSLLFMAITLISLIYIKKKK